MDRTFGQRFWENVCEYKHLLWTLLAINVLFVVALLFASAGIERGSASYVILVLDFVLLVPVSLLSIYLVWRCENYIRTDHF